MLTINDVKVKQLEGLGWAKDLAKYLVEITDETKLAETVFDIWFELTNDEAKSDRMVELTLNVLV